MPCETGHGNDAISGNENDDMIDGGIGNDLLSGNHSNDTCTRDPALDAVFACEILLP